MGVRWWSKQAEVADALCDEDNLVQRVFVMASHSVGKTFMCGGIVVWWYDTRSPSICLTTAPTDAQVVDLTWKEVRSQAPAGIPLLPKAPAIEDPVVPMHYAKGYVARDANSFQGRHEENLLIVFDEAVGVRSEFWTAADGMLTSPTNRWLAVCNPTDVASKAYEAYDSGQWKVVRISAVDHPNIAAELETPGVYAWLADHTIFSKQSLDELKVLLRRAAPPFPKAVRLDWLTQRVASWCSPVDSAEHEVLDFQWPPDSNRWYRPGPLFESRVLGKWPSSSIDSVWSDSLTSALFAPISKSDFDARTRGCVPEVGCDVARFGDDMTVIHVQVDGISVHHESHNGWSTSETAGRLKQVADQWGAAYDVAGPHVPCKVDDDGVGGGVVDQAGDYTFVAMSGARAATSLNEVGKPKYPNRRSEAWFYAADCARSGKLNASLLDEESKANLRRQLLSPLWKLNNVGQQAVERKSETKKRLGRSPDDADAFNLAHSPTTHEGMNVFEYYRSAAREQRESLPRR